MTVAANEVKRLISSTGLTDPRRLVAFAAAGARWGPSLATLYSAAALHHPNRPALVDDRGELSFRRLAARSTLLARGLRGLGLGRHANLGLFCSNHRGFVEANLAAAKAGVRVVYLNTGFAPPQLAEVAAREGVATIVCDPELAPVVADSAFAGTVVSTGDESEGEGLTTLHELRKRGRRSRSPLVARPAAPVLLTSGTTGTPKGAQRTVTADPAALAGLFERIPYRTGDTFVIPSPLFHAWGLSQLAIAAALGSTAVLVRRFDPHATARAVEDHAGTVLAVVPIMLQRMLAAGVTETHDLSSLRIVASSGSAMSGRLANEWMDAAGDTLYNLYGSTEVGQATIADPVDLREAPGTAGRVVSGTTVEILGADDQPVPRGELGRIFVGNRAQFSGYTGGGTKEVVGELMSSGDTGYFDDDDRLFVTGRADDMIVSGGENVFPQEVEEALMRHPGIDDVAVTGIDDAEFGQRLAAFVVAEPGDPPSEDAIRDYVATRLARHKVPKVVRFVDELPRTTTGKLMRRALEAG